MSIYKRGGVYWFKFMFDGQVIRATTKQGNDKVARQMEAAERSRLAKERDERKAAISDRNCKEVRRCPECIQWFDSATTIADSASGQQFCSNTCRDAWTRKRKVVPTLSDFCEKRIEPWAKSTFEKTSPKTYLWYKFGIGALKQSATLSKIRLDEIGPEKIAEFTSERQSDGLQVSSVNSCLRALRRVLRLAFEWKVVEAYPQVKFLAGERRRERVISPKEETKYLAAASPLLHDVSLVLFDTGMRPEECHRLRWESINWVGGRNGTIFIEKGKTKSARRLLPMSQRVRLMLESRWKKAGEPIEGWVWPAPTKDEHINHDSVKLQHKNALKLSKLRPFEIYSIRHTFLTRLGESGCDVWTLARIAGHSNISISQRYVHPSEDAVLNALSRLGGHKIGHNENLALSAGEAATDASETILEG
jgi:integrase